MTQDMRFKLESLGVDVEATMERMVGNENFYLRCLKTFLLNSEYQSLMDAIESKDVSKAFSSAHALKGVVANLGFGNLFKEVQSITEVFRSGSLAYDVNNFNRLQTEYKHVIDTINEF